MESLARSRSILQLGKELVVQLEAENDLLASWMSHYVAQRILEVEEASGHSKIAAEDSAARAILELWSYRNSLPAHLRPFDKLEPIKLALASLDVEQTDYRYYPALLRESAQAVADKDVKEWLDLAIGLDYSARILIQSALRAATQNATGQAEPWVELALRAGMDSGVERDIVNFVRGGHQESIEDQSSRDTALSEQISRLESFSVLAALIAQDLRTELGLADSKDE